MSIRKPSFLVSLITADNDYQIAQAASAEELAGKLGVGVQVVYAQNDAVLQCTQILKAVLGGPMDGLQDLRALQDGIILCVDNLDSDTELASQFLGGRGLRDLIVVIGGDQRDQEVWFTNAHIF